MLFVRSLRESFLELFQSGKEKSSFNFLHSRRYRFREPRFRQQKMHIIF